MSTNLVDLTVNHGPSSSALFPDVEDEAAFGISDRYLRIYKRQIWKLKQNDPNFALLDLRGTALSNFVCRRIGTHLMSSSTHMKNLLLQGCNLTESRMESLFILGRQFETNAYILKEDILGRLGITEKTLVDGIIESVTYSPFSNLFNVDVSNNNFGTNGLDIMVKALAGSPIESLNINHCGLEGINPLRGLRNCRILKKLSISGNSIVADDFDTISVLMDNGYPKLRTLDLLSCGIEDDLVELISPILSKNKSLRHLHLNNNVFGETGVLALLKAVHDTSSFEKTLASNHTVYKITADGKDGIDNRLYFACHPNVSVGRGLYVSGRGIVGVDPHLVAWKKYITHFAQNECVDMSPFMDMDVKLIPRLLARVTTDRHSFVFYPYKYTSPSLGYRPDVCQSALSAVYNLWLSNMFREWIATASQINNLQAKNEELSAKFDELECAQAFDKRRNKQLEDSNSILAAENKRLQEQIEHLMSQCCLTESKKAPEAVAAGSIAKRVKMRKTARKRERKH